MFLTRREYSFSVCAPGVGGSRGDMAEGTVTGAELTATNRGRLAKSSGDLVVEMEPPMLLADRLIPVVVVPIFFVACEPIIRNRRYSMDVTGCMRTATRLPSMQCFSTSIHACEMALVFAGTGVAR